MSKPTKTAAPPDETSLPNAADDTQQDAEPQEVAGPTPKPRRSRRRMAMRKFKAIMTLLLVALVAVFAVQNSDDVDIQFLTWSFTTPRALLVVLFLAVGFVLGLIVTSFSTLRSRR
jgi:uncharacterized integral membrane protein